ncbi:MAG: carbohydrate ABC transporter permease [Eubacteriales bacterium]|nr:carbohydrate ABC transporter permease [Eubacteriales bacterium]
MNDINQHALKKRLNSDHIFLAFDWVMIVLIFAIVFYPLWYTVIASFDSDVYSTRLKIWPAKPSLEGYSAIFQYNKVWVGYKNSIVYTVVGTFISMVMTIAAAYPLSRKDLRGRTIVMFLFSFTMYFSGGLIPSFLLVADLKMLDSIWALVIPGAISVYNMIVMRTYFATSIPEELLDASRVDGCSNTRFLSAIVIPLSTPILAVISMYYAIAIWNSYFNALIYITDYKKLPLQMILREILIANQIDANMLGDYDPESAAQLMRMQEIMKYSLILIASVPMLIIYPFVQRYFVKGVMIGAIKG